jgi:thymidylate kinase
MSSHSKRGRSQKGFINREKEFQLVENTFNALLDSESVPATPLIDFFGIDGIGKTKMLKQIEYMCKKREIAYIWLDVSIEKSRFISSISKQMQKYKINNEYSESDASKSGFYTSSLQAIELLLGKKPPVVVLLDSIDITNQHQFDWVETMIQTLIKNPQLCIVFASKQKISFERDWSMARKLAPFQLRPLDQTSSELYIKHVGHEIPEEMQKQIFEWTQGYPLAMDVMTRAIATKTFDLTQDEDQRKLVDIIIKRVIDKGILGKVKREEFPKYKKSLSLLAVPRRFNLVIMQELFEEFEPAHAPDSKLEYMALPQDLNVNTNILNWDLQKAGFTIDQAVRNILLLQRRIEEPEVFSAIHAFLAKKNKDLAEIVPTGTDHIRYLLEYLYHSLYSVTTEDMPAIIEQTLERIAQNSAEEVIQFSEEFARDEELRAALKSNVSLIDTFITEQHSKQIRLEG